MIIVFSNNKEVESGSIERASFYDSDRRLLLLLKNGDHVEVLPATDWDLMRLDKDGIGVSHKTQGSKE